MEPIVNPSEIIQSYVRRRGEVHWQDVQSHANAEHSCSLDYQGRFLFELLQNAADRADSEIRVLYRRSERRLYFGNDGACFTIYPYPEVEGRRLSDFHALCSIHTSSKKASESIGNKGVGFKSVWEVSRTALIRAKLADGTWWGFRLLNPLRKSDIMERARAEEAAELGKLLGDARVPDPLPSFYYPQMVDDLEPLPPGFATLGTVIVLELMEGAEEKVQTLLGQFLQSRIYFLSEKYPHKRLQVFVEAEGQPATTLRTDPAEDGWLYSRAVDRLPRKAWDRIRTECVEAAKDLGFHLEDVTLSVAIPPPGCNNLAGTEAPGCKLGLMYSYVPTEVVTGFNVLVHGDFFLDNSRKSVDFVKPLNNKLLDAATDLLLATLLDPRMAHREDFWTFLDPRDSAPPLREKLRAKMLPDGSSSGCLEGLLEASFATGRDVARSESFYHSFFSTMGAWQRVVATARDSRTRRNQADRSIWDDVRRTGVKCLPVVFSGEPGTDRRVAKAVCLPRVDPSSGKKSSGGNTVFFRKARPDDDREDAGELQSVGVFQEPAFETVSIMSWADVDELRNELRLTEFRRENIVRELGSIVRGNLEHGVATDLPHEGLLKLLWELLAHPKNNGRQTAFHEGCPDLGRIRQRENAGEELGWYLSGVHLPTRNGWKPAFQTYLAEENGDLARVMSGVEGFFEVDLGALGNVGLRPPPDGMFRINNFARLLGAWDTIPLRWESETGHFSLCVPLQELASKDSGALLRLLSDRWTRYAELGSRYPQGFEAFRKELREVAWFPVSFSRNETGANGALVQPLCVWEVEVKDRRPVPFLSKFNDEDFHGVSQELKSALSIVKLDSWTDVPADKIMAQLSKMREWWRVTLNRPAADIASVFKPRYRSLMQMFARSSGHAACLKNVPILVERGGETLWREDLPEGVPVYFYPLQTRRERSLFQELAYAVLDPDTPAGLAGELGLTRFDYKEEVVGSTEPDEAVKRRLEKGFPYMLSLVECLRVGGRVEEDFSIYLSRWEQLQIGRGNDVFRELTLSDVTGRTAGVTSKRIGQSRMGDVFLAHGGDKGPPRVVHDFPAGAVKLEAFAESIADGVFRNVVFTEYFARILDLCQKREESSPSSGELFEYLESRGVERGVVEERCREFEQRRLSPQRLDDMRTGIASLIHELTGKERRPSDVEPFGITVSDFLPAPGSRMTEEELLLRLPKELAAAGVRLRIREHHRAEFERLKRQHRLPVLVSCLQAGPGPFDDGRRELLTGTYDRLRPSDDEMQYLNFVPESPIRCFLKDHGVAHGDPLDDWLMTVTMEPGYAESLFFLEDGLRFRSGETSLALHLQPLQASGLKTRLHLTPARTSASRRADEEAKAFHGLSAERFLVMEEARRLLPEVKSAWGVLRQELSRIRKEGGRCPEPVDEPVQDVEWLARHLHVAQYDDGHGYDALAVRDGRLVRIEVKCSRGAGPSVFLSENEIEWAKTYLTASEFRDDVWNLVVFVEHRGTMVRVDATPWVEETIRSYEPPSGILRPVSYEIRFGREG